MNKQEFTREVAKRCNTSGYAVEECFQVMASVIAEKLIAGETVEIPKIGSFHLVHRKEMVGKNLFGDPEKHLNACCYPSFKIYKPLKTRVKNSCRS